MNTKRNLVLMGMLFVLLLTAACGGAAPTQAPAATQAPEYYPAATQSPATEAPAANEAPAAGYVPQTQSANPNSAQPNSQAPVQNHQPYDMFFQNYGSIH